MQFEGLGVRPECLISDLKTGRVDSYAALIADGKEAMELAIYHKVYELLAQTYNATGVASQHQVTNALTKSVLDEAINKVRKKVGGAPTIIADYDLCTLIESFDGFSELDSVQEELRNHGLLGKYRGCNIVYLPEILDPTTQESIVPTDKMFIVGRKIGVYGDYADMDFMQEVNINDKSWNCRIDKELGMAITKPEGIFVINIAA
jgi:hypothetical protein